MPTNDDFYKYLEKLDLGEIRFRKKVQPYIDSGCESYRQVHLKVDTGSGGTILEISPGDTIAQCNALYGKDRSRMIRDLVDLGWEISTNFHFSFMTQNIVWAEYKGSVEEYVGFWRSHYVNGRIRQYKRREWPGMLDFLEDSENIYSNSRKDFDAKIGQKNYTTIKICPGIQARHIIPMAYIYSDKEEAHQEIRTLLRATKEILS